ncbi:sensor domain-containing diguanylate cyclase [Leucobacter chromiireducens]|uniref:GGDEF domain-containing protein n=1 Tax=Leucobacter chromiireducens subsp. solipictus TaxID=398235 RepID=A0ABS1SCB1_9MICO|nr:GGDEF domain-containing protein [Leucobacter chromiireducens]MBL3678188.1 GGDEF domain-containing protein [Leucobacter chromiireducens subsp. solipictus]
MRRRQSELSIATALFLLSGGTLAALNASVFRIGAAPRPDLIATMIACFVAAGIVLWAGRRFRPAAAGLLMIAVMLAVVPTVYFAPNALRAVNLGLLFLPFFLLLVWFLPMWFARVLGYIWITVYGVIMVVRFGEEILPILLTLAVTGIVIGELIGRFKGRLERASITDPLCDVWNRRGFERLLGKAVAAAQRSGQPIALLYLDLDRFKSVNDQLGHAEGDRVLQSFARALQEHTRPEDVFARFGGDEFALLLIDSDARAGTETGDRLRRAVPDPGWSFGVAEWQPGETSAAFISRADLLMLTAKQDRR